MEAGLLPFTLSTPTGMSKVLLGIIEPWCRLSLDAFGLEGGNRIQNGCAG